MYVVKSYRANGGVWETISNDTGRIAPIGPSVTPAVFRSHPTLPPTMAVWGKYALDTATGSLTGQTVSHGWDVGEIADGRTEAWHHHSSHTPARGSWVVLHQTKGQLHTTPCRWSTSAFSWDALWDMDHSDGGGFLRDPSTGLFLCAEGATSMVSPPLCLTLRQHDGGHFYASPQGHFLVVSASMLRQTGGAAILPPSLSEDVLEDSALHVQPVSYNSSSGSKCQLRGGVTLHPDRVGLQQVPWRLWGGGLVTLLEWCPTQDTCAAVLRVPSPTPAGSRLIVHHKGTSTMSALMMWTTSHTPSIVEYTCGPVVPCVVLSKGSVMCSRDTELPVVMQWCALLGACVDPETSSIMALHSSVDPVHQGIVRWTVQRKPCCGHRLLRPPLPSHIMWRDARDIRTGGSRGVSWTSRPNQLRISWETGDVTTVHLLG